MSEEIQTQNELKEEAEKIETKLREALGDIAEIDNRKESEKMREQIKILNEYYLLAMNNAQIESNVKIEIEKRVFGKEKKHSWFLRQKQKTLKRKQEYKTEEKCIQTLQK